MATKKRDGDSGIKKTIIYAKRKESGYWELFKHGSHDKSSVKNFSRILRDASTLIDDRDHVVAVKIEVSRKK